MTDAWRMDGVDFAYPNEARAAVSDVSLGLQAAKMTALLGPNGAGKSTLLQLMLGTLRVTHGEIRFRDRRLSEYTRKALSLEIGVVPQGEVEPAFTVRELVAMGRYPHLGPWQRERERDCAAVDKAMRRADVAQFEERYLSNLSGGERQRVRVARALAQEARVLVLDEPTAFLDIRHEMSVFELLRELREEGVTIVLATHNINLAARYADALVLMDRGRVVAVGAPVDVLTTAQVSSVYQWPVDIVQHSDGAPQVVPGSLVHA